jgi:pimeloyl-ACP methyl ester carboxylesterase
MGSLGNSNLIILVVPGGASPAALYTHLVDHLKANGVDATVYDNPSSSRTPPKEPAGLADDAASVASYIRQLADAGRDIVLLPHSYGGLVANEAARGFRKEERTSKGLAGGIVRIVYLSCIVADVGETSGDVTSDLDFSFLEPVDEVWNRETLCTSSKQITTY